MSLLFVIIIILWVLIGILGIVRMDKDKINYCMIIFMLCVPFLPLIAKLCNIL